MRRNSGTFTLFVAGLGLALAACSPAESKGNREGDGGRQAPPGWPRRIAIPGGDVLELAAPAVRILPANASTLDLVHALLPPERIAALPEAALEYAAPLVGVDAETAAAWEALPRFAGFSAEEVLVLQPDLVLAHSWQRTDTAARLAELGIPVLFLPPVTDWASLVAPIETLGAALGVEDVAVALLANLEERRSRLLTIDRSHLSGMSYGNYGSGGSTAGAHTTWDLMIWLTGMRNAASEAGYTGHGTIDYEALLGLDPDVIVFGFDPETGRSPSADILRGEPAVASLRALAEGHFVMLPRTVYSTASHRLLDAAELLADEVDRLFPE